MKKYIMASLVGLMSMMVRADVLCGVSIESNPGSGIYNKPLFWDKIEDQKPLVRFLLSNGQILKMEELNQGNMSLLEDGAPVFFIVQSLKITMGIGKVKKQAELVQYESLVITMNQDGNNSILMANGFSLVCQESKSQN